MEHSDGAQVIEPAVVAAGPSLCARLFGRVESWRQAWLGIDRDPRALAFAQTKRGAIALHVALLALLAAGPRLSMSIVGAAAVVLAGCLLWPRRRALLIGGSGLVLLFPRPYRTVDLRSVPRLVMEQVGAAATLERTLVVGLAVVLLLVGAFGFLELQRRRRESLVARRPVATLLVFFFALVALASSGLLGPTELVLLWSFLALLASSFWFLAYALADQKAKDPTPNVLRLGFLRTFWAGSTTPVGKGPGYLRKFEAKDEAELAVTRLKALKLAVWGVFLACLYGALNRFLHRMLGLPTLKEAIALHTAGTSVARAVGWECVVEHYFLQVINLAASGHVLVSMIRMAGYRIPRNTVRPFAARTLAEFWNRYYFYFKELLVDFFFFPVFLRHFKKSPRLRLAFATFCAAGFGNFVYHFIRETHLIATRGVLGALLAFQSYIFYVVVLAAGLIVSQLRKRKPTPADGFWRYEILPRLNVALFFCFLGIFDEMSGAGTLADHCSFCLHLIGLS